MPSFDFTLVVEGVDILSDASQQAVDEYKAGFLNEPPLDGGLSRGAAPSRRRCSASMRRTTRLP
jgi:hypothetical protein